MSAARGNRSGAGAGLARVKAKLMLAIENGNFYEAHQMYRTMYFRLKTQKNYAELESVLFEGSLLLFQNGQFSSGVDLSKLYIQILDEGKVEKTDSTFQKIAKLYSFIPLDNPERDGIMASAIQWSAPNENKSFGNPRLHQLVAYTLWHLKRYPESRHHFLHSSDGVGCGAMLAEFHENKGYPKEVDMFIAGTVLQLICLRKHIVAAIALKSYTDKHPLVKKGPPYLHPLLNFLWLLLLAIEHKRSLETFSVLIEKYKPILNCDPNFLEYVDKIGQNFFDLPPPQPRASNRFPFMDVMNNFMTAFQDDNTSEMETEDLD